MSTAEAWEAIREEASATGKEHSKDKEIRLLKLTIEKQQAQLVAMDAALIGAHPDLEAARALAPVLERLRHWAKEFGTSFGAGPHPRAGTLLRGDLRALLLRLGEEVHATIGALDAHRGKPCGEPGCVLRPKLFGYHEHWHSDGLRQWKTVETNRGTRRFKRGAW